MNDYEKEYKDLIYTTMGDGMGHIKIHYEKAVILYELVILRQAVRQRMEDKFDSYKGIRMEDVLNFLIDALNFLIDALLDFDMGEPDLDIYNTKGSEND